MMPLSDILGWIGNVGFLFGAFYIARSDKKGFYWQIEGNFFYLWQSYILQITSLGVLSFILIIINIYGIYHWNKHKK